MPSIMYMIMHNIIKYILIYLEDKDMADYFGYIYMSLFLLSIIIREICINYYVYHSDHAAILT